MGRMITRNLGTDVCTGRGEMLSRKVFAARLLESREPSRRPVKEMYDEDAADEDEDAEEDEGQDEDDGSEDEAGDHEDATARQVLAKAVAVLTDTTLPSETKLERIRQLLTAVDAIGGMAEAVESLRVGNVHKATRLFESALRRRQARRTFRGVRAIKNGGDFADALRNGLRGLR